MNSNTFLIIIGFVCIIASFTSEEITKPSGLWKNPKYLKRVSPTRYVLINLHKGQSIRRLESRDQNYLKLLIKRSAQTFAWHNIKIVVKSCEWSRYQEPPNVDANFIVNVALQHHNFLKKNLITHGLHILFVYRKPERKDNWRGTIGYSIHGYEFDQFFGNAAVWLGEFKELLYDIDFACFSHELGHLFLLGHYDPSTSNCYHENNYCALQPIVEEWSNKLPYAPSFSGMAIEAMEKTLNSHLTNDFLLKNENLANFQTCGNGMVDPGEDCDCGFERNCILSGEIKCCNMTTCKFNPNVQCSKGECCHECRFKIGDICRKGDECHLDELCSGKFAFCPMFNKKPDGTPCNGAKGYCVDGKCPNVEKQCLKLYFNQPFSYEKRCIDHVYRKKDFDLTPKSERTQDSYCGVLTCFSDKLYKPFTRYRIDNEISGYCYTRGIPIVDNYLGFLPNGYKCGKNKMCLNNRCINAVKNYEKCYNVTCPDGIVCNMGKCEAEYKHLGKCKDVTCESNKFCNFDGKCVHYKVPEMPAKLFKELGKEFLSSDDSILWNRLLLTASTKRILMIVVFSIYSIAVLLILFFVFVYKNEFLRSKKEEN